MLGPEPTLIIQAVVAALVAVQAAAISMPTWLHAAIAAAVVALGAVLNRGLVTPVKRTVKRRRRRKPQPPVTPTPPPPSPPSQP